MALTIPRVGKKMTKQLLKLEKNVYHLISEIILTEEENGSTDLTVYMDDGYEVRAMISTFAEKMAYYPEITAQLQSIMKRALSIWKSAHFSLHLVKYTV